MTNIQKPNHESTQNDHSFDGITFEVVEEEQTQEGKKLNAVGSIYGKSDHDCCVAFRFLFDYCKYEW